MFAKTDSDTAEGVVDKTYFNKSRTFVVRIGCFEELPIYQPRLWTLVVLPHDLRTHVASVAYVARSNLHLTLS